MQSKTNLQATIALIGAAAIFASAGGLTTGSTKNRTGSAKGQYAFIEEDVKRAIKTNQKSKSFSQWLNSGYTPLDIFQNMRSLKAPAAWQKLCSTLKQLTPENAALFENEVISQQGKEKIPCLDETAKRLQKFWAEKSNYLDKGETTERVTEQSSPETEHNFLNKQEVVITFEGGPDRVHTPRILQTLRRLGKNAVFFQYGQNVREFSELTREAAEDGHMIASAGWSASRMAALADGLLTIKDLETDLEKSQSTISLVAGGSTWPLIRLASTNLPPYAQSLIQKHGLKPFSWTIDSLDWKTRNPRNIVRLIINALVMENRGVLRLHDGYEQTVIALPAILREIDALGFKTVIPASFQIAHTSR